VLSLGSFSKILAPGLRLGWIEASPSLISRISERGYVISGGSVAPFVSEIVAEMLPVLGAAGSGSADASGGGEGVGFGADGVGAGAEAGDGEPPIATETADEIATKTASAVVHAPSTGPCGLDHGVAAHLSHLVRDYSSACDAMIRAVRSAAPDLSIVSEPRGGFFAWVQLPAGVSADALLPIAERHGVLFLPGRACAPSCPPEAFDRYARLCFAMEEPAEIEEGVRRLAAAVKEARGATA
jgi:DNA-binding transcriptional MocR family regulator